MKNFRAIPAENVLTGKISLWIRHGSYIGIFRPFGTIYEVFESLDSVIPGFPESDGYGIHGSSLQMKFIIFLETRLMTCCRESIEVEEPADSDGMPTCSAGYGIGIGIGHD